MANKTIGEFQAIAGKGFDPYPAGTYPAEVTGAEFKHPAGKNPYFKLEFTHTEGPTVRRKAWDNCTLADSEGSSGVFFQKMRALRLDDTFWADFRDSELEVAAPEVCSRVIGVPVNLVEYVDEYPKGSGIFQNKVRRILPGAASVPQPTAAAAAAAAAGTSATGGNIQPPTLPAGL